MFIWSLMRLYIQVYRTFYHENVTTDSIDLP